MRFNKKLFMSIGIVSTMLHTIVVDAKDKLVSLEEANIQKICAHLANKEANSHCIKEQKDEMIIKQMNGKGFDYIQKNSNYVINNLSTSIGLQYFANELENKVLSTSVLDKTKVEQEKELLEVKKLYKQIKIKHEKLNKKYVQELNKWIKYKNQDEQLEEAVRKFAKNRLNLNKALDSKIENIGLITNNLNYYLQTKKVNKELILPLYLGEKINASKEECKIIKMNVPSLFEQKRANIKGC